MADPAIEAAHRAFMMATGLTGNTRAHMESAAREALKPIRELHKSYVTGSSFTGEQWTECAVCVGSSWPCDTAKLIYTTEELAQ
ncbi:hypothetical protein [Mycolicibacterium peregrinum]|uniref:hypothetical protein n=1 Tax=Mycolicibacterium peregrinum TaxID=43304 RepID=UPI003AAB6F79